MISDPEFVRGNQKSYIRIPCDISDLDGYEYHMCKNNMLRSLLGFQQRSQNGEDFLYYEVSGMQSLDVYLQTQKLKRDFAIMLAKKISFLCKELEEYALDIRKVVFQPKYIVISGSSREVQFLYFFCSRNVESSNFEELLECCVENLDYKDEELVSIFYQIYENLLNQGEQFAIGKEMDFLLKELSNSDEEKLVGEVSFVQIESPFEEAVDVPRKTEIYESKVAQENQKRLRIGLILLFFTDMGAMIFWKPLNLLKIFFGVALGLVLLILNIYLYKQSAKNKAEVKKQKEEIKYIEEYEKVHQKIGLDEGGTQIIMREDAENFLYNVKDGEPQCIYFSDVRKVIGKDLERVQVYIMNNGVSRLHAMIVREDGKYKVEDLNSTNGTWINGKRLSPRVPHILKVGDKVCFAEAEYIFR